MKKGAQTQDPRGLIHESFQIEGISQNQCRTIFLDWALWLPDEIDPVEAAKTLHAHYAPLYPGHLMLSVLQEAERQQSQGPRRRRRS